MQGVPKGNAEKCKELDQQARSKTNEVRTLCTPCKRSSQLSILRESRKNYFEVML